MFVTHGKFQHIISRMFLCRMCQKILPRESFGNDRQKKDGRRRRCKECDATARANSRLSNLTAEKARAKRYRETHRTETAERKRAYQTGPGKTKMLARSRAYGKTPGGLARSRRSVSHYGQTPKGRLTNRIRCARRRARIMTAPGVFTDEDWNATILRQRNRCYHCKARFAGKLPATIDHMTPISKGGHHSPENIVAACRPCNSRKRDRQTHLL